MYYVKDMEKKTRTKSRVQARYLQRWKTENQDKARQAMSTGEGLRS